MTHRRRRTSIWAGLALITSLVAAVLTMAAIAPPATAATPTVARLTIATAAHTDIGPFPGEWDESNAQTTIVSATATRLEIAFSGGTTGRDSVVRIDSEQGRRFGLGAVRPAVYDSADLRYLSTGCYLATYDVRDIAYAGDTITRLDLAFTTWCTGGPLAGNLQLRPASAAPVVGATGITWPQTAVGLRSSVVAPFWIRNPGPSSVVLGRLQRSGSAGADFTTVADGCSGRTLRAREGCAITVRFDPRSAGAKNAVLTITAGTTPLRFELRGSSPYGRTVLAMHGGPGDVGEAAGGGYDYLFTEAEMVFAGRGWPTDVQLSAQGPTGDWDLGMLTTDRSALTLGSHPIGDNTETPGAVEFRLTGPGIACGDYRGTVDIRQFAYGPNGELRQLSLFFDQYCRWEPAVRLRGEIAYRATTAATVPSGSHLLRTGQSLRPGQTMRSTDGRYDNRLTLSSGGQAVITDAFGNRLWSSPATRPAPRAARMPSRLSVLADGSVAITDPRGSVIWQQAPAGHRSGDFLLLQSDGNLVLYSPEYLPLWSSRPLEYRFPF